MPSAYEILTDILHDNDEEIRRSNPGDYANGLAASNARIRARMAGLPRGDTSGLGGRRGSGGGGGGGPGGDDDSGHPKPPPPPSGKVIDVDYTIAEDPRQIQLTPRDGD